MNYEHNAPAPPQFPVINVNILGKVKTFCSSELFANHVYNLIKWGKSSQNAVKQRIEDSACWIAGISFMSPRYGDENGVAMVASRLQGDALS